MSVNIWDYCWNYTISYIPVIYNLNVESQQNITVTTQIEKLKQLLPMKVLLITTLSEKHTHETIRMVRCFQSVFVYDRK